MAGSSTKEIHMLIETSSDGRQSSKDYVPPFDRHPKVHTRCFLGAECTGNHSDKSRPTIPSRSIEFCVVCLRLVSQKPFKPEGFITVVPFDGTPRKAIILRHTHYERCSQFECCDASWDVLNAVVICRGLCSWLAREILDKDPYLLLLLGELLKPADFRRSSVEQAYSDLLRRLTRVEVVQRSQLDIEASLNALLKSLPLELHQDILSLAWNSKAWLTYVYDNHIKPFLEAERNSLKYKEHMALEHPHDISQTVENITQSEVKSLGNSYVAIEHHEYEDIGSDDEGEDEHGKKWKEWKGWYTAKGNEKLVISLDNIGCRAINVLGDPTTPRGLRYRVFKKDEMMSLWCKGALIGDIVPRYARHRDLQWGLDKSTGGYFPWSTPGIYDVHASFTGPQSSSHIYTFLVTTYPVPANLSAITVGLTSYRKIIEVLQFHDEQGKGTNMKGLLNLLPLGMSLDDYLWIHFPLWKDEKIKQIHVRHRRGNDFFHLKKVDPPFKIDENTLIIETTQGRFCHLGPYIPLEWRKLSDNVLDDLHLNHDDDLMNEHNDDEDDDDEEDDDDNDNGVSDDHDGDDDDDDDEDNVIVADHENWRERGLKSFRMSSLLRGGNKSKTITHLHLTESREGEQPIMYVALTLDRGSKPLDFYKDDKHDKDSELAVRHKQIIWQNTFSPPQPSREWTRAELEVLSEADMGNVKSYRCQDFLYISKPPAEPKSLWHCIGMMLETSNGPIVLGQWIPDDLAKLQDGRLKIYGPFSAEGGILFSTETGSDLSKDPGPIFVNKAVIGSASIHANADTIISWWANHDANGPRNRLQVRNKFQDVEMTG